MGMKLGIDILVNVCIRKWGINVMNKLFNKFINKFIKKSKCEDCKFFKKCNLEEEDKEEEFPQQYSEPGNW